MSKNTAGMVIFGFVGLILVSIGIKEFNSTPKPIPIPVKEGKPRPISQTAVLNSKIAKLKKELKEVKEDNSKLISVIAGFREGDFLVPVDNSVKCIQAKKLARAQ